MRTPSQFSEADTAFALAAIPYACRRASSMCRESMSFNRLRFEVNSTIKNRVAEDQIRPILHRLKTNHVCVPEDFVISTLPLMK